MNSRERVLRAINRQKTDRPPVFATFTPQAGERLCAHLGLPEEKAVDSFLSTRVSFTNTLLTLGNDCVCIAAGRPDGFTLKRENNIVIDEWGIGWIDTGVYSEMAIHPLEHAETVNDIISYNFPDPSGTDKFALAREQVQKYASDFAIIAEQECTILELSWYMTGLEKFLMDLLMERKYIFELMDRVMEINLAHIITMVEMGADIVWTGDDIGNQSGMMLDPDLWRKHFKPRMEYIFSRIKKLNPDIKIAYHSCGSLIPVIPDLIEIGLDILNPIQPLAKDMEAQSLKNRFGHELMFFGGVDIQNILPFGSREEVIQHLRRIKNIFGAEGGYILAPAHNIQPDTPTENVLAFFEEALKSI